MEGGHTAIDGCLEELVLKRDRALCRCGTGIADLCIAEHRLLTVVAADDAAPVVGLARIRLDDNRLVRGTEGVDISERHDLYGMVFRRFGSNGDGDARHDIKRGAFRHLKR